MMLLALVIVLGLLSCLCLSCMAICIEINRKSLAILFFLLFINWFRQFSSNLSILTGKSPTESWVFRLTASTEGALFVATAILLSIVLSLIEFQKQGGVMATRAFDKYRAGVYATTRPGSGVVNTVVVAPVDDADGVKQVEAISRGNLPLEGGDTNEEVPG